VPDRLVIPSIGVDAPVLEKGLGPDLVMEAPDDAWTVAWYGFTALPGGGGNAVLSGHVDYAGVGPAVFWDLRRLAAGDVVEVMADDGTAYRYRVTQVDVFGSTSIPMDQVLAQTGADMVTIITCAGTFDPATREYDQRLVVRAERVPDGAVLRR
jgi:LPXTG-site transpeptidase (sortase) family protein